MTERKRPAFGIFEGGGAKGIAHVGALEAAEQNGLEFIGVAGASAGAIIATLVAAGFTASEVLDPEKVGNDILTRHHTSPLKLLDEDSWRRFSRFRNNTKMLSRIVALSGFLPAWFLYPRVSRAALEVYRNGGYFDTESIREFVNTVLRDRLIELNSTSHEPIPLIPDRIRFCDLDPVRFPKLRPLKIVVTDMKSGGLALFDSEQTPLVEIGEAVAASVAIPFVFKPVTMKTHDGGPFVDGGLVSNLPTWVFAEDKLAWERAYPDQPPVPIIGFSLVDKVFPKIAVEKPEIDFQEFVERVVRTSIFGSQLISQRFIEDLLVVQLRTELGVLDFDAPWQRVRQAFLDGKDCADKELTRALSQRPTRVRAALAKVTQKIQCSINKLRHKEGQPLLRHVRGNLIENFGANSFRVTHGFNMDSDTDDRLLLDRRGQGAPRAFASKTLIYVAIRAPADSDGAHFMTKYERALLRPTLKSAICVPIFDCVDEWKKEEGDRATPLGVFCFDSDEELEKDFSCNQVRDLVVEASMLLLAALVPEKDDG